MCDKKTNPNSQIKDYNRIPPRSRCNVDLEKAGKVWNTKFASLSQLFSIPVHLPGGKKVFAPTHMMAVSYTHLTLPTMCVV